ncbi:S-layer homology domain-containing protein [Cohnella fermenti]|uniref:DUF5018 domain-containing protein n=1 Tax=Cohnella fermenti TaxID=2565925 RepID=A0A4S4BKK2_9BACL|nr:S-layer homology domain-containing protein [Cohnella fermenti]THF75254.1 DUF5018 domain-containing protein [Cohnella fermenti]
MKLRRRAGIGSLLFVLLAVQWLAVLPAASAAPLPAPVNVLLGGSASANAPGSVPGSIVDGDTSTYLNTYDGTHQDEAWYAVTLEQPAHIDKVVYAHGHAYVDGGWFDTSAGGKPIVQIQTEPGGAWIDAGALGDYPDTSAASDGGLTDGQKFALAIEPVDVYGVRVIGKPVFFGSAAELEAFDTASVVDPNLLAKGSPSNSLGLGGGNVYLDSDPATTLTLNDGTMREEDWYAVTLNEPQTINNVVLTQGAITADGGWFDTSGSLPRIQIRTAADGVWTDAALLARYPATTSASAGTLEAGARFEAVFDPVAVYGVRVIGRPAAPGGGSSASSLADLQAYNDPLAAEANVLRRGTASYSRAGNAPGSFNDGDVSTVRNSWNGQVETTDWYAVDLDVPQLINQIVFVHGVTSPDGGWFNTADGGKPVVQARLAAGGDWTDLATVDDYPDTTDGDNGGLAAGRSFTLSVPATEVYGVRIVGRPAHYPGTSFSFSSIAELQAFYALPEREYEPLNGPLADASGWTPAGGAMAPANGGLALAAGQSASYAGKDYWSAAFHLKLKAEQPGGGGDAPSLTMRGTDAGDGYRLSLGADEWTLLKTRDGAATTLGAVATADLPGYAPVGWTDVLLAGYEERDGVRLQVTVGGETLLSVLDAIDPLRDSGRFGAAAGDGALTLAGIDAGTPVNAALTDSANWIGLGAMADGGDGSTIFSGGYKMYKGQQFGSEYLDFTMRYTFTGPDWPGIVLRGSDPAKTIFDGGSAYFIDVNANVWEVQKWTDGNRHMLIGAYPGQTPPFGTLANKLFRSGTEHTIRVGAFDVEGGVRLVLWVDGQKAFDIVDTDAPLAGSGYFGVYAYSGPVEIGGIGWEPDDAPNAYNDITQFDVAQKIAPVAIDRTTRTVSAVVADGTDLAQLDVSMTLSRGASISPDPSSVRDYREPVVFTVTAENGAAQSWTVDIKSEFDGQSDFVDIAGHPAKRDIVQVTSAGIMDGTDAARFSPDEPISRIDLIAATARAASLEPAEYNGEYADVGADDPRADLVQAAKDAGLLFPTSGGKLQPEQPATREEMAVLFAKAARLVGGRPYMLGDSSRYEDAAQIASWARSSVEAALGTGLLPESLTGGSRFEPQATVKRADAAVYLRRLLYENKPFEPLYNAYSSQLTDAFKLPGSEAANSGEWSVSQTNGTVPMSGTKWNEAADESLVFQSSIKHMQDGDKSWELRIGKGGQIYSLDTAIGELMPPQTANNVFMDEVIQPVSISYDKHNPDQEPTMYFIHGSGVYYKNDPILTKPFYDPMLAAQWNPQDSSYATIAWGQNAQIPSIWRSGLLYYTKVRDAGDGVIEVSYVLNNFGTDTIDDISIPWGGVRKSALPDHIIGNVSGGYDRAGGVYTQLKPASETGGWAAMTQNADDPDSFALATVFGRDSKYGTIDGQWEPTYYTWGDANRDDFYVQAVQGRFHLQPGEQLAWKFYYVVGKLGEVAEKAKQLANDTDYGFVQYGQSDADQLAYYVQSDEAGTKTLSLRKSGSDAKAFATYAQPVPGTTPLFLLRETATKQLVLTTDPFLLSTKVPYANPYPVGDPKHDLYEGQYQYKAYDGKTDYLGMLGYVYPADTAEDGTIALGDALPANAAYGLLTEADRGVRVLSLTGDDSTPATNPPSDPSAGSGTDATDEPSSGTEPKPETVVALDAAKLADALAALPSGGTVAADVTEPGDRFAVEVPATFIAAAAELGHPVTLAIRTPVATYELPLAAIDLPAIASSLGVDPSEVSLVIHVGLADSAVQAAFAKAAAGAEQVTAPREFAVEASAGGRSVAVDRFAGYVARSWTLDGALDPAELTALWLTPEGEARFAPAAFEREGDAVRVTIRRPGNSAYTVVKKTAAAGPRFADLNGNWAAQDVERLAASGIVKGVAADRFAPTAAVTRAEWATLLARALGLGDDAEAAASAFKDTSAGSWYAGAVGAAAQAGLVAGYEDGSFRPGQAITRQEMAAMLVQAFRFASVPGSETFAADDANREETPAASGSFADAASIAAWAKEAVGRVAADGLMAGRPDGSFAPEAGATRAEAAAVLHRLLLKAGFLHAE